MHIFSLISTFLATAILVLVVVALVDDIVKKNQFGVRAGVLLSALTTIWLLNAIFLAIVT